MTRTPLGRSTSPTAALGLRAGYDRRRGRVSGGRGGLDGRAPIVGDGLRLPALLRRPTAVELLLQRAVRGQDLVALAAHLVGSR